MSIKDQVKIIKAFLFFFLTFLFFSQCANKISLTGGPKDEIPPRLDTLKSSSNYQLRFTPQQINLIFDEFINFKEPSKNVVISPPLQNGLEIDQRGKEIKINFNDKEVFKPDATYIINFGESIADYTENNILKNFSFVFSSGDYIDSLSIGGKVIDSFTKNPVENITVMLYDNLVDSVVFTQKPFYFAKTNDDGSFKLKNLRGDTFKIVAINDLNLNYQYDENVEEFAFLNEKLIVNDTSQQNIELLSFKAKTSPRYLENSVIHDGLFTLKFDQGLDSNPVIVINNTPSFIEYENKDVRVYVKDVELYPLKFAIQIDSITDTISIRKPQTKDRKDLPKLKLLKSNIRGESGLHPKDTLILTFNFPLDSLNRSLMNMDESEIFIDSENPKQVKVINEWEEGQDYSLSLDSNAVIDFYGNTNDSSGFDFEIARRNAFGGYEFIFTDTLDETDYIVTLIGPDNYRVHTEFITQSSQVLNLNRLIPGEYSLEIIKDINRNKKWDTGSYIQNRQPEKIENISVDAIESNRTTTFTVDFEAIFNKIDSTQATLFKTEE